MISTILVLVIFVMLSTSVFAQPNDSGIEPPVKDWLATHPNFTGCVHTDLKTGESREITCIHPELSPSGLYEPQNKTDVISPLKQFKSGIADKDVKCGSNLHLIIKAEDGSFACVTIKTGIKLVLREWATTFGTGISSSDYTKCDISYPQSNTGVAVLYMPTNIIGKICVQYHNLNNAPTTIGMRIFEANDLTHNATNVTAWTYDSTLEANANKTVVYFIKTGNKTGFYGVSLNCGGIPLAVGYDNNSAITASNFPWIGQVFHCGAITYDSHIEGTTGIGVRYIPYSYVGLK